MVGQRGERDGAKAAEVYAGIETASCAKGRSGQAGGAGNECVRSCPSNIRNNFDCLRASVDTAVMALPLGAQDYLLKPTVFDELLRKVGLLMEHKHQTWEIQMLRREVNRRFELDEFVGESTVI